MYKHNDKYKKYSTLIIKFFVYLLVFVVLLFLSVNVLYRQILLPSYASVTSVCFPENIPKNFVEMGSTSYAFNTTTNKTTIIVKINNNDTKLLKHEYCHVSQFTRKLTWRNGCNNINLLGKYLGEVECYIAEELPNSVYEQLYKYNIQS
jgi:hypothetical protein